jgi:hypothetical protein
VNELVACTDSVPAVGDWRETGKHDRGDAATRCVVNASAEVLGSDIDVNQHKLWTPADHGVSVCCAQGGHFMRAHHHSGHWLAALPHLCKRFDKCRVVASQVGKQVFDSRAGGECQ